MRLIALVAGLWLVGVALLALVGGLVSWLWSVDPWAVGGLVVALWVTGIDTDAGSAVSS